MLAFLNAYGLVITIVTGILGIIAFFESRRHPVFRRPGTIVGIVALAVVFMGLPASLVARLQSSPENFGGGTTPIATSGTSPSTLGTTPTQVPPTQPPTPTLSHKPGDILYEADSSWSGWNGSGGWKVSGGLLLNDGTYADYQTMPTVTAPYQPGSIADYAVVLKMQAVNAMTTGTIYPCLYMTARGTSASGGWQGYAAAICANSDSGQAAQLNAIDTANNMYNRLSSTPFDPHNGWHTYRFEVKGTAMRLLVDGGSLLTADDSKYLDAGQIGLRSDFMEVKISSFKIIAL